MDPALYEAAKKGDVKFLKEAVGQGRPPQFFVTGFKYEENMFHVAARLGNIEFLKEAKNILPTAILKQLLLQITVEDRYTVLHAAVDADKIDIMVVKCINEMYASLSWDDDEDHFNPWLTLSRYKQTPLNIVLSQKRWDEECVMEDEECVMEIMLMDPALASCTIADKDGNTPLYLALRKCFSLVALNILKFLIEVAVQPPEYFLTKYDDWGENIFHTAAGTGEVEFLKEAMNILPIAILKKLLTQTTDLSRYNVLHHAALNRDVIFVKFIKQMYASFSWDDEDLLIKPWLALTKNDEETPLNLALRLDEPNEGCVMEILLLDPEFESTTIADRNGDTPLYNALNNGFKLVAEKILMSPLPYTSLAGSRELMSLFSLAAKCSDNVVKLMTKKCVDWIDEKGLSVLHHWVDKEVTWPCKVLLDGDDFADVRSKVFKEMIFVKEKEKSDTPLHIAARKKNPELGQILIRGYQQELSTYLGQAQNQEIIVENAPWKMKNIHGDTPLHCALSCKQEVLALEILSVDPTLSKIRNNKGESPFFLSVENGCEQFIAEITRIEEPPYHMLHRNDGTTVIHCLAHCPEETGRKVLEKYWWIANLRDDEGKTPLECARQANALWLITLLTNPSLIEKQDFDWIANCKRGETLAVLAFVDNCPDLQKVCREKNDTPLHHIQLSTCEEYLGFLKTPSVAELKNTTDHDGATPLHRALERKDMPLAQVLLLDDKVDRIITDRNGATAMDLLAKLCKENKDWEKMCKQINVNPYLKTSYIQFGTNLEQVRSSLSVVAALLATITFAAGFTLPGGINSDTGQALLAKKAGFLVFLLADVYAMCTAMLVLFCLMWSMVSEADVTMLLVDRSVFILMQSLYGTLLTFVTGIYVVIAHSTLWIAIVTLVMCSIIGICANRTILHKVIVKLLIPDGYRDEQYRTLPQEEEMEIIIQNGEARPI